MFQEGMQMFWTIVFGAIIVEGLVEIIKQATAKNKDWRFWLPFVFGEGIGVLVSWNYGFDFFQLAGLEGKIPLIGIILTGFIMGRGANFVSDVLGRINAWKAPGP